ncbi:MAG: radical SAM protein [Clostridiales Family XIII bacterium]|nr:radical SAM protein [Clostridiales Family XIII bacterium]
MFKGIVPVRGRIEYNFIYVDLTRQCNARCVFCFNDWDYIEGTANISRERFEKASALIGLAKDCRFYLSCLFEPTLHPDFTELLRSIPQDLRGKVQFTTNLARKMDDGDLRFLADAGFGAVNISVETFDEAAYGRLFGIKNTAFFTNIEKLSAYAKASGSAARFRFITMMVKDNREEYDSIYGKLETLFPGCTHEYRTPWFFVKEGNVVIDESLLLTDAEFETASQSLRRLKRTEVFLEDPLTVERHRAILGNTPLEVLYDIQKKGVLPDCSVRISADGKGIVHLHGDPEPFDLDEIDAPEAWFSDRLAAAKRESAAAPLRLDVPFAPLKAKRGMISVRGREICALTAAELFPERHLYVRGVLLQPVSHGLFVAPDGESDPRSGDLMALASRPDVAYALSVKSQEPSSRLERVAARFGYAVAHFKTLAALPSREDGRDIAPEDLGGDALVFRFGQENDCSVHSFRLRHSQGL